MDDAKPTSPTLFGRVLRALAGCIPGVGLGLVCYLAFDYGLWASLFVGAVGAFIGAALAQPGVSTANVLKGTAGVMVAYNAPKFMRDDIIDHAFGESPRSPESPEVQQSPQPSRPQTQAAGDAPDRAAFNQQEKGAG